MENQERKRRRKIIKKVKGPELVRSVRPSSTSSMVDNAGNSAILQFQNLWR